MEVKVGLVFHGIVALLGLENLFWRPITEVDSKVLYFWLLGLSADESFDLGVGVEFDTSFFFCDVVLGIVELIVMKIGLDLLAQVLEFWLFWMAT